MRRDAAQAHVVRIHHVDAAVSGLRHGAGVVKQGLRSGAAIAREASLRLASEDGRVGVVNAGVHQDLVAAGLQQAAIGQKQQVCGRIHAGASWLHAQGQAGCQRLARA